MRVSSSSPFALSLLALVPAAIVFSTGAAAQGLPSTTDAVVPVSQTAATTDATALLTNPAGLAFVEGLELSLGGLTRVSTTGGSNTSNFDALAAASVMDGLVLGFGSGVLIPDAALARWWTSGAVAIAADRALSAGLKLTATGSLAGGGTTRFLVDAGFQVRPARLLAFGAAVEGLGDGDVGPATARVGVSVRPLHELLTVGIDARFIPGEKAPLSSTYFTGARIVPAVAARVDIGGLAFGFGVSVDNLGAAVGAPPTVAALGSVEVNGGHVGANLIGGADGILGDVRGVGGVRVRGSTARWASILPDAGRFVSLTLTGDGVPVHETDNLLDELFAEHPPATLVLAALDNAADDDRVLGVVLRLRGLQVGWGRAAELRNALAKLKAAGKKVVVHLDSGGDLEVYIASIADRIYLSPAGSLDLNGLRAEMVYFADTLAKIGIRAQDVHAGTYKSAPRTFTATEPSEEELEVENALLDSAYATLVSGIATGRGLSVDEVKQTIDLGGLTANRALEKKIIDGVAYADELEKKLEELMEHPVNVAEASLDDDARDPRWDAPAEVAIIPIVGTIMMGSSGGGFGGLFGGNAGADDIIDAIEEATKDSDIKAIVLRIDSPGGDALASDLVWHAVMTAREKKPVIASMGDVAASGGYYIAAAAHTIIAEPDTITGSIGVFGLLFEGEELADKLGVHAFEVNRGALPGPSALRPLTDEERAALQGQVDATYERFLDAVIEGRGTSAELSREALRENAEGRVWTGAQARERKLVDQLGGLVDALALARQKANLEDDPVALTVITGRDGGLPRMMGLASVLSRDEREGLRRAAALLLGDPAAAAFLLENPRRPMTLTPGAIRIR